MVVRDAVLLGALAAVVLSVVVAWWERRQACPARPVRVEQCCRCNAEIVDDEIHTVVERASDDGDVIDGLIWGAGTGMSADFCGECCPGGCSNAAHAKLVA